MKIRAHNPSFTFRIWAYFRTGWAVYFAFLMAAVNTLITTYYLAINNISMLQQIFPTFTHYIVIVAIIGIPLLTGVGYFHFKRSQAFKSESDIRIETNIHQHRMLSNTESILLIIFKWNSLLIKKLNDEKITKTELEQMNVLKRKITENIHNRTVLNKTLTEIDNIIL